MGRGLRIGYGPPQPVLNADVGAFALAGQDSAFLRTLRLTAAQGSIVVTGQSANLTESSAGGPFKYVRTGASGSATGDDWTNAYTTLPSSLTRGTTYLIADGSYAGYTFDDATSSTQVITVKKATVADHGTDSGWSDAYGDGEATFSSFAFTTSHWLIDGAVGGGPGSWDSGFGFVLFGTSEGIISSSSNPTNITVRHTKVYSNRTSHAAAFKNTVGGFSNHTFSYCMFAEIYGPILHIGSSSGLVVEYSYLFHNRSDGDWHGEGVSTVNTNTNATFRWNLFNEVEGTSVFAGINSATDSGWKIYGNIFAACPTSTLQYIDDGSNNASMNGLIVANNTIVDCGQSSQGGFTIDGGSGNVAHNNLFYQNDHNQFSWSNFTHSYSYASKNIRSDGGPFDKDAEILTGDSNGQGGSDADPFVGYNANPLLANYDATTSSGLNTNSILPENAVDMLGNTRGSGGVWTRGAIQ